MIKSNLKKLAQSNGLTVAHGVAYGNLRGYAVTLSSVAQVSRLVIVTRFADPTGQVNLQSAVNGVNIRREYSVSSFLVDTQGVHVDFTGKPEKIQQFLDFFMPLLPQCSAYGANACPECGYGITDGGKWKLVNGVAYPVHPACGEKIRAAMANQLQPSGSYLTGTLGALIGTVLGSIVWALILSFGFFVSIAGLLIGFLAQKGYDLLHGRQGKLKVVILIVMVILGVLIGNLLGYFIVYAKDMMGIYDVGEIFSTIFEDMENSAFQTEFLGNIAMGLLFAGLGVGSMLVQTGREVSEKKYIDLD